ncbi:16S rRNA (adenine(1518)-N(6)/adenine(1519)-N(6))-dimethyltransferase RsmA [Mycoplasmopsis primatum]|uniref:16S rRNA (adenine(1518)-N(6)/adenine(1519)-N(6))- dimethyltransferase RsmA n=1 Tax=Mycoplasmopsis primatum TaxID=55604 RepID=UPI000496842D|nr:16S rRNA (adenine(1518)-N(6)/adenine(1519)-N(6))-dimethyltransferase RsmA [Mycoplasmopsis primatum]
MQKNIKAKKKFGQNFLNNSSIIKKIIGLLMVDEKNIIEIGPGKGALTKELVNITTNLICFEIDHDMVDHLSNLGIFNNDNKLLIQQDFLTTNLTEYSNFTIIGNIPYYITSEIILKIIENRYLFKRAILMVQKEVADRIVAQPNTDSYSKLSLTCQYVAKVKKELFVSKSNFTPTPKVDSAIVSFDFYQNINDNYDNLKDFFKLCFLARRKKLFWSLQTKYDKSLIINVFKTLNLNENIRIQQLNLETILELYKLLN